MSVGAYVRCGTTCYFKSPTTGLVGRRNLLSLIAFARVTNTRQQPTATCSLGDAVSNAKTVKSL